MTGVSPEYSMWGPKTACPYDTRQVEEVDEAWGFKTQEIVTFAHGIEWRNGKNTKIGNKVIDDNGQHLTVFVVKDKDAVYFKTLKDLRISAQELGLPFPFSVA